MTAASPARAPRPESFFNLESHSLNRLVMSFVSCVENDINPFYDTPRSRASSNTWSSWAAVSEDETSSKLGRNARSWSFANSVSRVRKAATSLKRDRRGLLFFLLFPLNAFIWERRDRAHLTIESEMSTHAGGKSLPTLQDGLVQDSTEESDL
jgi:hypothetical protein